MIDYRELMCDVTPSIYNYTLHFRRAKPKGSNCLLE